MIRLYSVKHRRSAGHNNVACRRLLEYNYKHEEEGPALYIVIGVKVLQQQE